MSGEKYIELIHKLIQGSHLLKTELESLEIYLKEQHAFNLIKILKNRKKYIN